MDDYVDSGDPANASYRLTTSIAVALPTNFVLDALEHAIYDRCGDAPDGLVHYSDRGTQHLSMQQAAVA